MKSVSVLSILVLAVFSCQQASDEQPDAELMTPPLWESYDRYREAAIVDRFIKHEVLVSLIEKHAQKGTFINEVAGISTKGRSIHHLTMGKGKTRVLLWSQMHGDESTATMALFDLFNFFASKDEYDSLRSFLLSRLELHFVPMLNPDGAEVWERRNALDIDINRDARLLSTPEGRTLMGIAKSVQPVFGFNLHDQSVYYAAGTTRRAATISFLSPAFNYNKDMNDGRAKATQVILVMNEALQEKIPGNIAKYDDTYDPRCFGDTFQGMGISTILIESGGYPNDIEKQHIRKVNFYGLIRAFESIARGDYAHYDIATYDTIPENRRSLYDLVIRNLRVEKESQSFTSHLAITRSQIKDEDQAGVRFRGVIEDLGDLNKHFGYHELNAAGLKFAPGQVSSMSRDQWDALTPEKERALLKEGILFVKQPDAIVPGAAGDHVLIPITAGIEVTQVPRPGASANFLLTRDGKPEYAVINGQLIEL